MRPFAVLLTAVLLLTTRSLSAGSQPSRPADSVSAAKQAREAAKRSGKEAERVRKEAEEGPPTTVIVAPLPRADRPTMNVLDFRYATVTNQDNYQVKLPKGSKRTTVINDPSGMAHEDNLNIGAGIADLVKSELTTGQSFRILERPLPGDPISAVEPTEPLDSMVVRPVEGLRARLILTGSITRFGGEDQVIAGAGLLKKALGGVGVARKRTVVELTAKVLDAATGEVLLSITGFGMSRKGGGLVAVGGTEDGVVGGGSARTNVTAEAIGEASRLAAQDLAAKITNARDLLLSALKESQRPDAPTVP